MQIRVAWLQLRNARNSPCKHLMLGRSPQILSPRAYHPLSNHHNGWLFITSAPAFSSVCFSFGFWRVLAGWVEDFLLPAAPHGLLLTLIPPPVGRQIPLRSYCTQHNGFEMSTSSKGEVCFFLYDQLCLPLLLWDTLGLIGS